MVVGSLTAVGWFDGSASVDLSMPKYITYSTQSLLTTHAPLTSPASKMTSGDY